MVLGVDGDPVGVEVEGTPHEGGVPIRAVVALRIVLDRVLPVRRDGNLALVRELEVLDFRREHPDLAVESLASLHDRPGVQVEVDEHEAAESLGAHPAQADRAAVEIRNLLAVPGEAELTGELIAPVVVGTHDRRAQATRTLHQPVGAVLADVVEGAKLSAPIAQHHHALITDVPDAVAAGLRDAAQVTDVLPGTVEDCPLFELEHAGGVVVAPGQRMGAAGILGKAPDIGQGGVPGVRHRFAPRLPTSQA